MLASSSVDIVKVALTFRSDPVADTLHFCLEGGRTEIGGALHVEVCGGGIAHATYRGGEAVIPLPEGLRGEAGAVSDYLERAGYRVERNSRTLVDWYVVASVIAGEAARAGDGPYSVSSASLPPKAPAGNAGASAGRAPQ